MYERPDVPKESPYRNVIAVVVLLLVAGALVALVTTLWQLANEHSKLGDTDLSETLAASAPSADSIGALAAEKGVAATGDDISCVLFAVSADGDEDALVGLRLAVLNSTQGTAKLVELLPEAHLNQDASYNFSDHFAMGGAEDLVSLLAGKGCVPIDHAVVMSESGWNTFVAVAGGGSSTLRRRMTELLEGIVSSDMDAAGLLDVAEQAVSAGASLDAVELVAGQTFSNETETWQGVDGLEIGLAIGTLA